MGNEYRIICSVSDAEAKRILEATAYFAGLDSMGFHEYRKPTNPGKMPDAYSRRESYGFYFCDNGSAQDILGSLVAKCLNHVPVTVEDLEQ